MYFANSLSSASETPLYLSVLKSLSEGKAVSQKTSIDSAIKEAIEVAQDKKKIFAISNENYFLVSTLLSNAKEFLLSLDISHINDTTYAEIIRILSVKNE